VIAACDIYCCLLPQCEALHTCCSGFSDCNKMVLCPGCEVRATCNLHKKNVQLVWFIVNRRGCCFNLSVGIALNVRFITNGMCAKDNIHIYMWHEQAIIGILSGDLYCCLLPQCEALRMPRLSYHNNIRLNYFIHVYLGKHSNKSMPLAMKCK